MTVLVTGGSGYLGSHIVKRLVKIDESVRVLVRNPSRAQKEGRLRGLAVEWAEGDVTAPETLSSAMQGVTAVIHTVAIAIEKGRLKYETVNYQGTVNVVEAAKRVGVQRFINMAQLGADSHLPYRFLASKGRAQEYVAASGLNWTAFRPSVIWGPEDEFANTFARLVLITPIVFPIIGDGQAKFQPVWVEDVVTCVIKALDDPETIGKEYELGGPEVLTIGEIEWRTLKAVGTRRLMLHFTMPIISMIVTMMEKFLPAPPVTRSLLELLAINNVPTTNAIYRFVPNPRPFTAENAASYMRQFTSKQTLDQLLGR
jgi:uncharacterized protein YbjT (DUF2867 family)